MGQGGHRAVGFVRLQNERVLSVLAVRPPQSLWRPTLSPVSRGNDGGHPVAERSSRTRSAEIYKSPHKGKERRFGGAHSIAVSPVRLTPVTRTGLEIAAQRPRSLFPVNSASLPLEEEAVSLRKCSRRGQIAGSACSAIPLFQERRQSTGADPASRIP